jgi:N,N'-diacetyllegionaminate synthase
MNFNNIKNRVIIIAEAGVNHNGKLKNALKMIDIASKAKADFIKFQTFDPESLANADLGLAKYQKDFSKQNNHLNMLKKFFLSENDFKKILERCKKRKINFLSSPFDIKSIKVLKNLKVNTFKIPSGQINDIPYLQYLGSLKKKIILSTGMSSINDVKNILNILTKQGTNRKHIQVLHCTSQYPADIDKLNLRSIQFIRDKLRVPVGYSDHSLGYEASLVAIGLGARIIEKHFTLNKNQLGPDHKFSLGPKELFEFVKKIRNIEKSLGKYSKQPNKKELLNLKFVRKKIIAQKNISIGEIFNDNNIITKRSSRGLSATCWSKIIGKRSKKEFKKNQAIQL